MLKSILAVMALAFTVTAHADVSKVYAKWAAHLGDASTAQLTFALDVQAKQTTFSNTCTYQGQTVTASATVPSTVTDSQILVQGSAVDKKNINDMDCTVDISPETIDYVLSSDSKTLSLTINGSNLNFTRQ